MIGRKAYSDPLFLSELQNEYLAPISGRRAPEQVAEVVDAMANYAETELRSGTRLHHITRHMLGLFNGRAGARGWRRYLSQQCGQAGARAQDLRASLDLLHEASRA